MKFTKMHGCGNDYIYVNGFTEHIDTDRKPELVRRLSDRHFGIGGDGVIFINPGEKAAFEMEMYNADGTRAQMCGNGIRCVAKYVYDYGLTDQTSITIESFGKVKYLELTPDSDNKVATVKVNMGVPVLTAAEIPVLSENERVVDEEIEVNGKIYKMTCVSMGNPHAVVFIDDVIGQGDIKNLISKRSDRTLRTTRVSPSGQIPSLCGSLTEITCRCACGSVGRGRRLPAGQGAVRPRLPVC